MKRETRIDGQYNLERITGAFLALSLAGKNISSENISIILKIKHT